MPTRRIMLPRRRTLLRLLIVPGVLAPATLAAMAWRAHEVEDARQARRTVMADAEDAFERGDWASAVRGFGRILGTSSADAGTAAETHLMHLAMAQARADAEGKGPASGLVTLSRLNDSPKVFQLRADLYAAAGQEGDRLHVAEQWLALQPRNGLALRHRREALAATGNPNAIDAALVILEHPSADATDRLRHLELLARFAFDAEAITAVGIDAVEEARDREEGLVEAFVLLSRAYELTNKPTQAATCLDQAVDLLSAPPPPVDEWTEVAAPRRSQRTSSAEEVLLLVDALDNAGRHLEATRVLADAAQVPQAPTRLLLRNAVRLSAIGRDDEGRALWEKAEARGDVAGHAKLAWLLLERGPRPDPAAELRAVTREIARVARLPGALEVAGEPRSTPMAPLHVRAANAASALGDGGLELYHLRRASATSPYAPEPLKLLIDRHVARLDVDAASRQLDRLSTTVEPNDPALLALRGKVAYAAWQVRQSELLHKRAVTALNEAGPPAELVPLLVRLTHDQDPAAARALAVSTYNTSTPAVQLRLAIALHDVAGDEPTLPVPGSLTAADDVLDGARLVKMRSGMDAVRPWLDNYPEHAALARARLLEQLDPDEAPQAWDAALKANREDAATLVVLLREAASLTATPEGLAILADATNALAVATAGVGPSPRRVLLHRATVDLAVAMSASSEQEQSRSAIVDAARRLRDFAQDAPVADDPLAAEARLSLSDALVALTAINAAESQLVRLNKLRPDDEQVLLRLLNLLERLGRHAETRTVLATYSEVAPDVDRVSTASGRIEIALRLAEHGDVAVAADLLSRHVSSTTTRPEHDLVLVDLLQQAGRSDEAAALLDDLVTSSANGAVLLDAAVAAKHSGDGKEASRLLETLLDRLDDPADRESVRGTFAARTGQIDQATEAFAAVERALPAHPGPWREAVAFHLNRQRADVATAVGLQGVAASTRAGRPADVRLRLLLAQAETLTQGSGVSDADQILRLAERLRASALLEGGVVTASDLRQAVLTLREHPATPEDLGILDAASRQLVYFPPLLRYATAAYAEADLPDQATRVMRRAAEAVPTSSEYQQLAYGATRNAGDADAAFRYARRWMRLLSADSPRLVDAETAVADSLVLRGRYEEAAALLEPRLSMAMANPGRFGHLLYLAAEATAAQGRIDVARQIIQPQLPRLDEGGRGWRRQFARLAADVLPSPEDAADWLRLLDYHVDRLPPGPDADEERLMIAIAQGRLGVRVDDASALRLARLRLTRLLEGPLAAGGSTRAADQAVAAWTAYARVSSHLNDHLEAEKAWRRRAGQRAA